MEEYYLDRLEKACNLLDEIFDEVVVRVSLDKAQKFCDANAKIQFLVEHYKALKNDPTNN